MAGFNAQDYITVAERVEMFYAKHPSGRIVTNILEHNAETGFVLMQAFVYRTPEEKEPAATGHAYELRSAGHVQQGSYIEVCETSAVGRAIQLLGFDVKRSKANGAARQPQQRPAAQQQAAARPANGAAAKPAPQAPAPAPDIPDFDKLPPAELKKELIRMIETVGAELGYSREKIDARVDKKYSLEDCGLDNCGVDILKETLLSLHKLRPPSSVVDATLTAWLRHEDAKQAAASV